MDVSQPVPQPDDPCAKVFREQLGKDLAQLGTQPVDPNRWAQFKRRMRFCSGEFGDEKTYERLKVALEQSDKEVGTAGDALFYFSIPPDLFALVAKQLAAQGLTKQEAGRWRRVIVEKPFGHDLASARAESRAHPRLGRKPDLPNRPLPGQRNRAEPVGVSNRQRGL